MIFTHLFLFLIAIFAISATGVPEKTLLPLVYSLLFLGGSLGLYFLICRRQLNAALSGSSSYFREEKRLSFVGLFFFSAAMYLCDIKYYLVRLPFANHIPSLANIVGILVFLLYLSMYWLSAQQRYQEIFGKTYSRSGFILLNIRTNLPVFLPWIILSLCSDLLLLLPYPGFHKLISSQWGDLFSFALFLVIVSLFLPPFVKTIWACKPLPDGYIKKRLHDFCAKQNFTAHMYIWPLFEGRMLTAAVMGLIPSLRYILLTPAILEEMTIEELEAVLAHEIGHVKYHHLLLYLFLLGGFSMLAGLLAQPVIYLMLASETLSKIIVATNISPETLVTAVGAVPFLVVMLLYFRFVFGFFIRNFERQADYHVLEVLGNSSAIVATFNRIADLSGENKEQTNWHHFGIGERIRALLQAEKDPQEISRHARRLRRNLVIYSLILVVGIWGSAQIQSDKLIDQYKENVSEAVLLRKARQEPGNALWHRLLGDLMLNRKMEAKALAAYQKSLAMEPSNPEVMNNYAWLLLSSSNTALRDPVKALDLAETAVLLQPAGYVYDTLAVALWANNRLEEALAAEQQAIQLDPKRRRQFQLQLERMQQQTYQEAFPAAEK